MDLKFIKPDFSNASIEFRVVNDEVCIYATSKGLEKLAAFCGRLAENKKQDHIHLEDYEVLTPNSLRAIIANIE